MRIGQLYFQDNMKVMVANSRHSRCALKCFDVLLSIVTNQSESLKNIMQVFTLPNNPCSKTKSNLPPIEVVIISHHKDYPGLANTIQSLVKNSVNKISRINIIIDKEKSLSAELVRNLKSINIESKIEICILLETDYFKSEELKLLRELYNDKSGWMMQQVLKFYFVAKSKEHFVLVWDADTQLSCKTIWVSADGISEVFPNWHLPQKSAPFFVKDTKFQLGDISNFSFTSHYLLMRPIIVREILKLGETRQGKENLEFLLYELEKFGEYDYYAKFAVTHYPDRHLLGKWSNLSINTPSLRKLGILERLLISFFHQVFRTISIHKRKG